MASSGKKNKKSKGKTLALNDFLQETPGGSATVPIRKSTVNWADEVEDAYDVYDSRAKTNVVLPTAPKAARGPDDYSDKIPQNPPYSAYLSNLPYDISEEEIADFFSNLRIAHMRIPKDEMPGEMPKSKGYGYIEFEDRESLVGALAIPDCTLKNRRIRIEVATNSDNDRRRGGRMSMNRDRPDRPDTFTGDWRSGPRSDPIEGDRRGGSGGGFSRDRETPSERDKPGGWRDGERSFRDSDRGFSRDSDRGFSRDSDRGFSRDSERGFSRDSDRGFSRDSDRGFNREFDRDKLGSGRDDRGRFGDRDDRRGFGPRRNDRDDRNGGFTRKEDVTSERSEPRTRPKLVLAPRTKPLDQSSKEGESLPTTQTTSSVPAASIFGSAKPVDTSAKERQIEERLAKETQKLVDTDRGRDFRRDDVKSDDSFRRSPRRISSDRKSSPEYNRRRSLDRKSPDRRSHDSRSPNMSPERRSVDRSPDGKRSIDDKWSTDKKLSPDRKHSPDRKRSPERKIMDKGMYSPVRRRSIEDRSQSPVYRKNSPSPVRRKHSPDRTSPELKNKGGPPKKIGDDKEKKHKSEKPLPREKDKGEKKIRDQERELPKLKEPEPPNFAASNKFAFLPPEDSD